MSCSGQKFACAGGGWGSAGVTAETRATLRRTRGLDQKILGRDLPGLKAANSKKRAENSKRGPRNGWRQAPAAKMVSGGGRLAVAPVQVMGKKIEVFFFQQPNSF
jgi:hypothetical protein